MKRMLCAILCALCLTGLIGAESYTHEEAGIAFEVPDTWTTSEESGALLIISPDGASALGIIVPKPNMVDRTVEALVDSASADYPDITLGDTEQDTLNGMDYFFFNAWARTPQNQDLLFEFGVLSARMPVILYWIHTETGNKEVRDALENLLASFMSLD